ncbi:MAG: winged helix-turn-helix domain-containing protein, partial [Patescibacteria group bacterium]
ALLRRPEQVLPNELNVPDRHLDSVTRKVTKKGQEVNLTLKEFNLLEYLMRNPDRVLTREQITDHLWDFAFDSFSNVVDAHIKNLRKKIGDSDNEKILETIRGVGYRIKK